MSKISKITPQQQARLPHFIQKWVDAAGKPIDREMAKKRLNAIMPDRTVIFAESMHNFADLTSLIIQVAKIKRAECDSQLRSQLRSQLDSQLGSQLRSQLRS